MKMTDVIFSETSVLSNRTGYIRPKVHSNVIIRACGIILLFGTSADIVGSIYLLS